MYIAQPSLKLSFGVPYFQTQHHPPTQHHQGISISTILERQIKGFGKVQSTKTINSRSCWRHPSLFINTETCSSSRTNVAAAERAESAAESTLSVDYIELH